MSETIFPSRNFLLQNHFRPSFLRSLVQNLKKLILLLTKCTSKKYFISYLKANLHFHKKVAFSNFIGFYFKRVLQRYHYSADDFFPLIFGKAKLILLNPLFENDFSLFPYNNTHSNFEMSNLWRKKHK